MDVGSNPVGLLAFFAFYPIIDVSSKGILRSCSTTNLNSIFLPGIARPRRGCHESEVRRRAEPGLPGGNVFRSSDGQAQSIRFPPGVPGCPGSSLHLSGEYLNVSFVSLS